jgi:hypothetical protein
MNISVKVRGLSRRLADTRVAALAEAAQRRAMPLPPPVADAVPPPAEPQG